MSAYFTSWECTCDHDPEAHTWGRCDVELPAAAESADGLCPCEAGWEE